MKRLIVSMVFLILISGCSSKISSIKLSNHDTKHSFLKKMKLSSAEVIFKIENNELILLELGKNSIKVY